VKVLLFSGSHPRHTFIHQAILDLNIECAAVVMEREDLIPKPPSNISQKDRDNFIRHFQERDAIESSVFGRSNAREVFKDITTLYCNSEELNTDSVVEFVVGFNPDWVFIFGVDLIKDPLLSVLPDNKINLHLGLSPWYKGSATLFWPFYYLQPQYAGFTFHQIVSDADAGDIIHQAVPDMKLGDGVHDIGSRTVVKAKQDLSKLIDIFINKGKWDTHKQRSSGRLYLTNHFHPSHLRLVYETFNNKIVDSYLLGELGEATPKLINGLG